CVRVFGFGYLVIRLGVWFVEYSYFKDNSGGNGTLLGESSCEDDLMDDSRFTKVKSFVFANPGLVFNVGIDVFSYALLWFNFAVVVVVAVFMTKALIFVTQSYKLVIGVLMAYWFTMLPNPLRLLVELAISRYEDILALVYEARPIVDPRISIIVQGGSQNERAIRNVEEGRVGQVFELSAPLIQRVRKHEAEDDNLALEGIGLGSLGAGWNGRDV
nr:presenilin-like protein At2g29900 [Tanacetum cinerariifolium]